MSFVVARTLVYSWPQISMAVSAVLCGAFLVHLRKWGRCVIFCHYYMMLLGTLCTFTAGFIFWTQNFDWDIGNDDHLNLFTCGCIIGGIGCGLIYVPGLSYLHIRTESMYRLQKVGWCYVIMVLGTLFPMYQFGLQMPERNLHMFSHYIMYGSVFNVVLFLLNEVLHLVAVYNYKRCLDPVLALGDAAADNFEGILTAPKRADVKLASRNRQYTPVLVMMVASTVFGYVMNRSFRMQATLTQLTLVNAFNSFFIKYSMLVVGALIGMAIMATLPTIKYCYGVALYCLTLSTLMMTMGIYTEALQSAAIAFLVLYTLAGLVMFVPDFAIMETASLRKYELALGVSVLFQKIPGVVSTYVGNYMHVSKLYIYAGQLLCICVALGTLVILRYPDTLKRSQIEVQYMMMYNMDLKPEQFVSLPKEDVVPSTE